jgi:hypothetical protein
MEKKIYIKDWLELKPYKKQTAIDGYYLKLCNNVKHAITSSKNSLIFEIWLDNEDLNLLSCFLTSYFEDIISETNIWNTFVKIHQRFYNKQLPFYILDDYYEEEINPQDISFLIWYFLNTVQNEKFISPFNDFIVETAEKVMDIFDAVWDEAPGNIYLKSFYQIDKNETDYYVARTLIDKILFKTYLFYPDTSLKLKEQELEIIEKREDDSNLMSYLNEMRDVLLNRSHTRLLGLKGKEWAAEILGSKHPRYSDFLNLSQRIRGYFLYKGQDDHNVFIEHIASGKKFELTKKSFDHSSDLKEADTILFMGIAQWRDEWWFSGVFFQQPFNADIILDEKNSLKSRKAVNFLDHLNKDPEEILQMQFIAFKEIHNGSQIAFLPSDKIKDFFKAYVEYYNKSLNLSEKEIEEANQRIKSDGFNAKNDESLDFHEVSESGLLFFNPKSGIEIALAVNSAFPHPDNPYFEKDNSEMHIMRLLIDESISAELAMYCIDNFKRKLPFFKKGDGKAYLDDIDFLLRFWKKDNYHAKPEITYAG